MYRFEKETKTLFRCVQVAVSGQFFGWLTGLGEGARIIAPTETVKQYCDYVQRIMRGYENEIQS